MQPERLLSLEEEQQWQELSLKVDWAEQFSLIILFVADARLAECFKQRLQDQLMGRVSRLHVFKPLKAETLTADIFNVLQQLIIPHALVPLWLELHLQYSPEWLAALDYFFARFNERRNQFQRDYPRPFIMLLPLSYRTRLREIAPDLWSVRTHTDELRPAASDIPNFVLPHKPEPLTAVNKLLSVNEQVLDSPEIREWQRVKDLLIADSELFLVTVRAFDAALKLGEWSVAETLAEQLITLSHKMIENEGETPLSVRRLFIALDSFGRIKEAFGDYEEARQAYAYCLYLCRKLKQQQGDTPKVLRDLSVSLEKVADIDNILGRYEAALSGYSESLEIRRELKQKLGTTPEVLRDLSVSLNKVAGIDNISGRYEAALSGYTESLQIRRELKQKLGTTPEVLRDLSVSLDKVADIDNILGRYEAALSGYSESLEIFRELKQKLGVTPQVLRDLSISLDRVANIDNISGRYEAALSGYSESLHLCRKLKQMLGVTPEVLRDLSIALEKLADCEMNLQHNDKALAAYQECLRILEQLQAALTFDQYSVRINKIKAKILELEATHSVSTLMAVP